MPDRQPDRHRPRRIPTSIVQALHGQRLLVSVTLLAAVALLLATSPVDYDFVNSDSTHGAMNRN